MTNEIRRIEKPWDLEGIKKYDSIKIVVGGSIISQTVFAGAKENMFDVIMPLTRTDEAGNQIYVGLGKVRYTFKEGDFDCDETAPLDGASEEYKKAYKALTKKLIIKR